MSLAAARHLVKSSLIPHFARTPDRSNTVVLAGFGRFGQTVLYELEHAAGTHFKTFIIIDLGAKRLARVFGEEVGFEKEDHQRLQADLRDPETWGRVWKMIGETDSPPVFILGFGDDHVNVRTGLWLASSYPNAKIVARCFRTSPFTERIKTEALEIISAGDLLCGCSQDELLVGDC